MDHAPGGDSLEVAAQVQGDGGFERGNGQLVDAQGAEQRVLADSRQRLALAGDDAGLRAAQQLVAAEGDYVDARLEARRHLRLVLDPERREVNQAAAAQVLEEDEPVLARELDHLVKRGALREAHDAEIARVDAHQHARALAHGGGVIGQARAVGGAHLAQDGAALGADVDRKSTRLNSSHGYISYAVFCLKKKKKKKQRNKASLVNPCRVVTAAR